MISVVLSLLILPSTTRKSVANSSTRSSFSDDLLGSLKMALRPNLWPLLLVKVLGGVSASMYSTALPILLTQRLKFEPASMGLSMSSGSIAVAVFGAVGLSPLTAAIGAARMSNFGLLLRAAFGCLMALVATGGVNAPTLRIRVALVSVLHGLASHMLATGLTTQTTGAVSASEQGALLGLEHGLFSMARIVGPTAGTWLLLDTGSSVWPVAIACGVVDFVLVLLLLATAAKRRNSSSSRKIL